MTERQTIWCERGGVDGPVLVLLHGLGGNGAVWDGVKPLLAEHWPGRWVIPDFRGHGRSFHSAPYGIGVHAADVAALFGQDDEVILLGHSMGGAVAIALATGLFGLRVQRVIAFSVKVEWTADDVARGQAVAQAVPKLFDSRAEAIERYLRVSGLKGLLDADGPAAAVGVSERQGRFRLAADPLGNALGAPDVVQLARAIQAPLELLSGEGDPVAPAAAMRRLGAEVTVLPGLGHNPHVEAPAVLWQAINGHLPSRD